MLPRVAEALQEVAEEEHAKLVRLESERLRRCGFAIDVQ